MSSQIISLPPIGEKIPTSYGYKKLGASRFIIVAPHAAGDDWKTARIARRLAKALNASLIINKFYFKPTNPQALANPDFSEDFNNLRWSHKKNRYLWSSKKPAMKEFFQDIRQFTHAAKKFCPGYKAVVVYIHGMSNNNYGIDIGVGLKKLSNRSRFIHSAQDKSNSSSGLITIKISQLKQLHQILESALLPKFNLPVSIGQQHIGWSKKSANQFHKHQGRSDYAIQLEISRYLRQSRRVRPLIEILSQSLLSVFKNSRPC